MYNCIKIADFKKPSTESLYSNRPLHAYFSYVMCGILQKALAQDLYIIFNMDWIYNYCIIGSLHFSNFSFLSKIAFCR